MDPDPEHLLLIASSSTYHLLSILTLVVLLVCSALISGAEVAFFSLTSSDLLEEDPGTKRKQVIKLLENPNRLLATILVANNFINIAIVLLFSIVSESFFAQLNTTLFGIDLRFFLEVGVVTFLILLFGEILPKVYASRNKLSFSHTMALPLTVLDKLFYVFTKPLRLISGSIEERLGTQRSNFSIDHLSHALELTDEEDTTSEEQKILKGIVSFGNTDTRQVMQPRMDIFALNVDFSYKEVIDQITERGYSRIPVYEESVDQIKGILYAKDLLPHLNKQKFDWKSLLRDPYFVPENKKLDDLLNDFKNKKNHLAIVVDEYGGTSGLISMEDIIEEIVGDISDEYDDEDVIFSMIDEYTYVFDGKTQLKDFYKVLKIDNPQIFEEAKGDAETIAGFLLEMAKGFPKKNEILRLEPYTFTIEALDKKRIKQVKVKIDR
ncbi:gliding motility-associated protein GldE [Gangjinia marincola]|uniref:Gliding motility-associated protein GldE n=1 Tax=Gangjinia marincola TaxID=578463 RepID=A0ABP3XT43_9FLAO